MHDAHKLKIEKSVHGVAWGKSAKYSSFTPLSAKYSFREYLRFGAHALVPQVCALSKLLFTLFVMTRRCGGQFALRLEAGASLLFSGGDSL